MKHAKQAIKQAVQGTGEYIKAYQGPSFQELTGKSVKNASSVKDTLGISDETAEGIYGQAYLLYNTGRYRDAAEVFRLLITMTATEPKYIIGLAACFHMLKEYQSAGSTYNLASIIDPDNPIPFFHASDCYLQLGDKVSAASMLEMAIKRAGSKTQYATLKQRAEITLDTIKKDINKILQNPNA
jgi:type III secretion system low calcium response chaperone LcrH/SycD